MSLPITVVGAGDNLVIPATHSVVNAAWTIAPGGIDSLAIPFHRVYDTTYNGGDADFAFTAAYTPPTPYVALYFGSSTTQFALSSAFLSDRFGTLTAYKTAQDFAPVGIAPGESFGHRVYDSAYNGASADFDFTAFHAYTATNVAFYFGSTTTLPITVVGVGAPSSRVGVPWAYRNYVELTLVGWDSLTCTVPRAYAPFPNNGAAVDFAFVDAYTPPTPYLNLYFGVTNTQALRHRNPSDSEFGVPTVVNVAQSAAPAGIAPEPFGVARLYDETYNGASVDFHFVAAYTPWNAQNVAFYFVVPHGGVYVRAINFTPMPQPVVTHWQQAVRPLAWTYHQFGYATAYTLTQYVFPYNATPSSRFGHPAWANSTRMIFAWGGQSSSVVNDDATIELRARLLTGVSAGLQVAFGTQYVADYYQVVRLAGAFWSEAFGTPKAEWLVRFLHVLPSADPPSVMPPLVGRHVPIYPEGFQSSAFGTFIAYNGTPVWPVGWRSSGTADTLETRVRHQRRFLPTQTLGIISSFDHATVYNLDQYVLHINGYDALDWAKYGTADVQNFIKTLRPFGWRSDRFAFFPADLRQPYQVIPEPIAPPAFPRPIQVAFRIRYFPMLGIDSYVPGRWMVVWKHAKEVYPVGIASEAYVDRPESVVNRNRKFKMHWELESMEFGTAMVAYRIRRVYHWFPYEGSRFPITLDVRENPHPVFVTGWDQNNDRHAAPTVEEHFTIIHPWGKLPAWPQSYKGATVENRNRSYRPGTFLPLDPDRYGRPRVENWIRYVYPQGKAPDNVFGSTDIRDNKQYPSMAPSWISHRVPWTHKVEYTSITPYVTRRLFVGEGPRVTVFGSPTFPRVQIFPQAIAPVTPPKVLVKANSIWPKTVRETLELDTRMGLPFIAGPQWIEGVWLGQEPRSEFGKPQMAHWTVWCRFDAPRQAQHNYPGDDWQLVDSWKQVDWSNPLGQFGNTWVALKHRTMQHRTGTLKPAADQVTYGGILEQFGSTHIQLKKRWVYTMGRSFMRIGVIDIPTSPRTIYPTDPYHGGYEGMFGWNSVQHPFELGYSGIARPGGWKSHEFGTNAIELFNRTIGPPAAFTSDLRYGQYVDGLDGIQYNPNLAWPAANGGQPPTIVGPTRVGFPIKRQMTGIPPVQEPQAALVAYKIRHVYPVGSDMLQTRSRLLYGTNSKMRVWKAL